MEPSASRVCVFPGRSHAAARVRGYSLTSLSMAMAVAGTLAATAVPAMQDLVLDQRLVTHVNQLFGDLQLARSEAIRRGTQVTLCKSSDGAACSSTSDWQDGWIVFTDENGNEAVDSGETIIRVQQSLEGSISMSFSAFGSSRYIAYFSSGESEKNGTFTLCDTRGATYARGVIVSYYGRVRAWDRSLDNALDCD